MKTYLENKTIYVKNDEDFIYKVTSFETYDNTNIIYLNLQLVTGIDYVNTDESDIINYVPADRFVEDIQNETVIQCLFEEGMIEALKENGYKVIEKLPKIY